MSEARVYEYQGEKHTLEEWSEICGIKVHTLRARIKRFGEFERAINLEAIRSEKDTRGMEYELGNKR